MADIGKIFPFKWCRLGWGESLTHLLWPRLCLNCQSPLVCNTPLCPSCAEQLMQVTGGSFCPRCGMQVSSWAVIEGACPQCLGRELRFERLLCCGIYDGPLRQMIVALKKGQSELAPFLGHLMQAVCMGAVLEQHCDVLVPVPLHWTRQWWRGYNQTQLLAKEVGFPIYPVLKRVRRTPIQPGMTTWAARKRNVKGAFALKVGKDNLKGLKVCLVDDVKTSGATLDECARILRQAGVASVWALVLAVAGSGGSR